MSPGGVQSDTSVQVDPGRDGPGRDYRPSQPTQPSSLGASSTATADMARRRPEFGKDLDAYTAWLDSTIRLTRHMAIKQGVAYHRAKLAEFAAAALEER